MKLLSTQQIRDWDAHTMKQESITSIDLMECAAMACVEQLRKLETFNLKRFEAISVFCGKGNNGGDGLAIARILAHEGLNVKAYIVNAAGSASNDFLVNEQRLKEQGKSDLRYISTEADFPSISQNDLIIDAIFGSGLNKPLSGLVQQLVNYINNHTADVIAIDIPSGLKGEVFSSDQLKGQTIIKAKHTFTFQVPKQSFMFPETYPFVGNFFVLDIGLSKNFPDQVRTAFYYISPDMIQGMIKPREKFSHKGIYGHALLVGGSYGKIGAAALMSKAALRTGCGLVTAFVPKVGYTILQTAFPECMVMTDDELYEIRNFPATDPFDVIGVGPGLGMNEYTIKGLHRWLSFAAFNRPCVIDADALNICARLLQEHHETFRFPQNSIITPHPKEFDRLAGVSKDSMERLEKQLHFSMKHQVTVVLKGAHTSIAFPDGELYFNSTGNPAMATAGSGDVLTGVLTSLLAQDYSTKEAALLGVYLHGAAGDFASKEKRNVLASDIIEALPVAFNLIR